MIFISFRKSGLFTRKKIITASMEITIKSTNEIVEINFYLVKTLGFSIISLFFRCKLQNVKIILSKTSVVSFKCVKRICIYKSSRFFASFVFQFGQFNSLLAPSTTLVASDGVRG